MTANGLETLVAHPWFREYIVHKTPDETGQILRESRDPQLFRDFLNSLCLLSFTHFNPSLRAEPHALMLQIKEPSVLL